MTTCYITKLVSYHWYSICDYLLPFYCCHHHNKKTELFVTTKTAALMELMNIF